MSEIALSGTRNYLRVRGEYFRRVAWAWWIAELPPRARRIRAMTPAGLIQRGTTSACAENTRPCGGCRDSGWNYLRVRGEYLFPFTRCFPPWELPPRARRIRLKLSFLIIAVGTTSACAENTAAEGTKKRKKRNYLRVRGEYPT